jgi:hypothetical protein
MWETVVGVALGIVTLPLFFPQGWRNKTREHKKVITLVWPKDRRSRWDGERNGTNRHERGGIW